MKFLFVTTCAAVCFALGTAIHLGPLKSAVKIGIVGPSTDVASDIEVRAANNVIGLLEYARRLMTVGIDEVLKVTEPFKKDVLSSLVLDSLAGPLEGIVQLTNLVASGAQQFTIHNLGVVLDSKRLEYNISVPVIVADIDFVGIDLNFMSIFRFNTSGSPHIILTDLNVQGALSVESDYENDDEKAHYFLTGIEVENTVEDVEVNVSGVIPESIIIQVKDALMDSIARTAILELESFLSHFTVEQIKHFLEV